MKYKHGKCAKNKSFQVRTRTSSAIILCKARKTNSIFLLNLCQLVLKMYSSTYDMNISLLYIYWEVSRARKKKNKFCDHAVQSEQTNQSFLLKLCQLILKTYSTTYDTNISLLIIYWEFSRARKNENIFCDHPVQSE